MNEKRWTPGIRAAEKLQSLGIAITQPTDLLARLIDEETAAPELYQALSDLVVSVEETFDTRRGELKHLRRLNAARVALTKARGEL